MKQIASLVALLASLCFSTVAAGSLFKNAEQLLDSNFDSRVVQVEKDSIWLVVFYMPNCHHC